MTLVQIPTRGDVANYKQRTTLNGFVFLLTFRYNDRDSSWYLTIADKDNVAIRSGIKLVPNFPISRQLVDAKWPQGDLLLFDTRPNPVPPLLGDLGVNGNAMLLYQYE